MEEILNGKTVIQGGIQAQALTSSQNLHMAIGFPPVPVEWSIRYEGEPVLMTGIVSTGITTNSVVAAQMVRQAGGEASILTKEPMITTAAAPSAVTVGAADQQVLAASSGWRSVYMKNTSTANISLALGTTAVLLSGITLAAGEAVVIDTNLEIRGIAASAGQNLSVQVMT